jgi:hypothetical protein
VQTREYFPAVWESKQLAAIDEQVIVRILRDWRRQSEKQGDNSQCGERKRNQVSSFGHAAANGCELG